MSLALIIACIWVVASAITAMLPMRAQFVPGIALLVAAPALIFWIGHEHGYWLTVVGLIAFVSMFRNPLRYFWKRARGLPVDLPPEIRDRLT